MKTISRARRNQIKERRHRRTEDVMEAIHFQLDACREDAGLTAMVVADEYGMCLAASGASPLCAEVAARLPILARKAGDFEGVLLGASGGMSVGVKRVRLDGTELFACVLGGDQSRHGGELRRAELSLRRILAA
jgi:hypothetical protein